MFVLYIHPMNADCISDLILKRWEILFSGLVVNCFVNNRGRDKGCCSVIRKEFLGRSQDSFNSLLFLSSSSVVCFFMCFHAYPTLG